MRVNEVSMEEHRNEGVGETGDPPPPPQKTRRPSASSGTIPTCENPEKISSETQLKGLAYLKLFPAFQTEQREDDKGCTAQRVTKAVSSSRTDKIDVKHVYTEVDFAIGSQFIRYALDDSESISDLGRGGVVSDYSSPTKTNRVRHPLQSPELSPLHSVAAPHAPRFTLIGSQGHDVKNRPNICTLHLVPQSQLRCTVPALISPSHVVTATLRTQDEHPRCDIWETIIENKRSAGRKEASGYTTVPSSSIQEPRGGLVVRLLNCKLGEPGFDSRKKAAPWFSYVGIVADDAAGQQVFSVISRSPRPCIPTLLHNHVVLLASALKTSIYHFPTPRAPDVGCSTAPLRHSIRRPANSGAMFVDPRIGSASKTSSFSGFIRTTIPLLKRNYFRRTPRRWRCTGNRELPTGMCDGGELDLVTRGRLKLLELRLNSHVYTRASDVGSLAAAPVLRHTWQYVPYKYAIGSVIQGVSIKLRSN
ncbi:hypothetical protein PR048_024573 [Dryococelus australis]|uniref:Uncharacterized protein n=1 Tax=Dryococelus australis TaxID=614101 RepID=A0ABQ9GNY9_9NEOP|nr:hypothetical protein PR048_024573 [Dryococelus australis]